MVFTNTPHQTAETTPDQDRRRWAVLGLLGVAELLGMSLWFTASAVATHLQPLWSLDTGQVGWLTTVVQIGFVAGTAGAALFNLADILPSRAYFAASAVLGSVANAALVLSPGYASALLCRFFTGFFLAGVYPPAMKMIATWFRSARGLAIGAIVGALTIGKAAPYLLRTLNASWQGVVLMGSAAALGAALLVGLLYRDGPYPFARRPFSWNLVGAVAAHRPTRLAIGGYLGHMWELYAMWTWTPAFIAASVAAWTDNTGGTVSPTVVSILSFGAIAAGGLGCVWGGWAADRVGRARLVNLSMYISGACALIVGLFYGAHPGLLVPIVWIWGYFVVADSAQFSTLVTEAGPSHAVGTALTLQTSVGFLLTMATIQLVPAIVSANGWPWAFPVLALGPACGIAAIRRLQHPAGASQTTRSNS